MIIYDILFIVKRANSKIGEKLVISTLDYSSHAEQRAIQRNFSDDDVEFIKQQAWSEVLSAGRYSLPDVN